MGCYFYWTGRMEEFTIPNYTFREFNYQFVRWLQRHWREIPMVRDDEFECEYKDETVRIEIASARDGAKITIGWSSTQQVQACNFVYWLHRECGAQLPDWFAELRYRREYMIDGKSILFARSNGKAQEDKLLASIANKLMRETPYPSGETRQTKYVNEIMERAKSILPSYAATPVETIVTLFPANEQEIPSHFQRGEENLQIEKNPFLTKVPGVEYRTINGMLPTFLDELQRNISSPSRLLAGGNGWAEEYLLLHHIIEKRGSATIQFFANGQHFASIEALQTTPSELRIAVSVVSDAWTGLRIGFLKLIPWMTIAPFREEPPQRDMSNPTEQKNDMQQPDGQTEVEQTELRSRTKKDATTTKRYKERTAIKASMVLFLASKLHRSEKNICARTETWGAPVSFHTFLDYRDGKQLIDCSQMAKLGATCEELWSKAQTDGWDLAIDWMLLRNKSD